MDAALSRFARLSELTVLLADARSEQEIVAAVLDQGFEVLGASGGFVVLPNADRSELRLVGSRGFDDAVAERWRHIPLEARVPAATAYLAGRAVVVDSQEQRDRLFPDLAGGPTDERVSLTLPLRGRGGVLGSIGFAFGREAPLLEPELVYAEALAGHCASALERARLHEELGARANAAAVLERIGEGVCQVDESGRILIWNPAAARITGVAAEDALGRPMGLVLPGWDPVATAEPKRARESLRFELAGRELWLSFSAVQYPEGAVYAFRDLTGERALEEARRDFVATASHELRTPLSSVYGAARTLLRRTLDEAQRTALLSLIVDESSRLSAILDELLLASRLDAGALTLQVVACDAAALVRSVVELARERVPETIELALTVDGQEVGCLADPDRLRQVLVNLVDNAIKYSPGGGRVDISVGAAAVGGVRIAVADRGLGIPAAERERIFEKFYRLDPSLTRGVGGTGLGLYICRQLVHGMGGRIAVDGRDGGGSVFVVELRAG